MMIAILNVELYYTRKLYTGKHITTYCMCRLIVVSIERWSQVEIHGCNHLGTCPSGLYREVVLIKGGLFTV